MAKYAVDVVAKDMVNLLLTIGRKYKDKEVPDKIRNDLLDMYRILMLYLSMNDFTADDMIRMYLSINRKKSPLKQILDTVESLKTNKRVFKLTDSITMYYTSFEVLIEIEEDNPDIISYVLIKI